MGNIKETIKNEESVYRQFDIHKQNDYVKNYNEKESYFGDGRYPPDWKQRREAVWWLQENQCGRCGRDHNARGHVHHIRPLSEQGTNKFSNLIGLCADCHKLLHPDVQDLNGDCKKAPLVPCSAAEEEVAIIKKDQFSESASVQLDVDFNRLAATSSPGKNRYATASPAVYGLDEEIVKDHFTAEPYRDTQSVRQEVRKTLENQLHQRGYIPRNSEYKMRELIVNTPVKGILGKVIKFEPTAAIADAQTTGEVEPIIQTRETDSSRVHKFVFSADVIQATITVIGGDTETHIKVVRFTDEEPATSISVPVSRPSSKKVILGPLAKDALSRIRALFYMLSGVILVPIAGLTLILGVLGIYGLGLLSIGSILSALFLDGSWSDAITTMGGFVLLFFISGICSSVLEYYGIDMGY